MTEKSPLQPYYNSNNEKERLSGVWGQLEFVRSQEIVSRYLRASPAVILDVGGATGRYSCWLAKEGHEVHLVDPVPLLVEQAREASDAQSDHPIASCSVGDARSLEFSDFFADTVLMFGPLYHLTEREQRIQALQEAARVLKPGGYLLAVAISRYASAIDGLNRELVADPEFLEILNRDLTDGQHRNHTDNIEYFTDAFFHHPEELRQEFVDAGFDYEATIAIEGIGALLGKLETYWIDDSKRDILLDVLRQIEKDPSLVGASPHIMEIGRM